MFSVHIPLPSMDTKTVQEVEKFLDGMKKASQKEPVRGGVVSEGDAAAYALVWEWGNARQVKKGPRTTEGTNPDGETVWLSIQAPFGYVRINEEIYVLLLMLELAETDFENLEPDEIHTEILKASQRAGVSILALIRETVPIDSGALKDSLVLADPDDPDLKVNDDSLELGTKGFQFNG